MTKFVIIWMTAVLSSCGYAQDNVAKWQEDIDVYAEKIVTGHINPFHTLAKNRFDEEVRRIRESVPKKNENEILVELMRLTRKIDDGHTSFPLWGVKQAHFPLEFKSFGRQLHVVGASTEHKEILGAKLISINGTPAVEVFNLLAEIVPFSENEFSAAVRVASYLPNSAVLNGLGITKNEGKAKFEFEVQGASQVIHLVASKTPQIEEKISPLSDKVFTSIKELDKKLWFGASADKKTVYIKFGRYPTQSKMEDFARSILDFINTNKSTNLIVDLRDNYGGDFFVGLKLAQLLVLADSINWKSGVYTLIDNVTFSAAMSNAAQFSQILNSKLVGEPTGAKPSGYQDMGQFKLPNSALEVTFSKRLYHFKDGQQNALYPDALIEVAIQDYLTRYDRQLRWVLSDINNRLKGVGNTLQGASR